MKIGGANIGGPFEFDVHGHGKREHYCVYDEDGKTLVDTLNTEGLSLETQRALCERITMALNFLERPYAEELVRTYDAMAHNHDRRVLVDVAVALGRIKP